MPNIRRSVLFAALAVLFAGAAVGPAAALTPTSPNKDQTAGKPAPKIVPEDPATSGSSTEPLSEKLDRSGGVIHPPAGVDPGMTQSPGDRLGEYPGDPAARRARRQARRQPEIAVPPLIDRRRPMPG